MIGRIAGNPTSDAYNRIPYPSYSYSQTYPDHLATLGLLTGISPKPVERSRILELGCASGGNLIPIAYSLPESDCLGIDFSGMAIKEAKDTASKLEVKNVSFLESDFMKIDNSLIQSMGHSKDHKLAQFDYIIAHGIFSWVSQEVQNKILSVCQDLLAPNGIAYFSYNVYPGWHLYRIVRDFMFFHTRGSSDNQERIKSARSIIEYLSKMMPNWEPLLGQIFVHVQRQIKDSQDGYVRHDFLEEVNEPIYFSEFIERASAHGLQFLANADLNSPAHVPEEVAKVVMADVDDDIEIEQYMDFLRNRFFRQTLLCRQELPINRTIDTGQLTKLLFTSQMIAPSNNSDVGLTEIMVFEGPNDLRCSTAHPLTKAALIHLSSAYPRAVPFKELVDEGWQILASTDGPDIKGEQKTKEVEILKHNLVRFYVQSIDLMRFHTFQPQFVTEVSDKPQASVTARHQAMNQQPVTNLYHQGVTMDQFPRDLLGYLDGQHNLQDLLDVAVESVGKGMLEVSVDGKPVEDPHLLREHLPPMLDSHLELYARTALLVA
jgi:methyltransferase-like protein